MKYFKVTIFLSLVICAIVNAQWSTNYKNNLQITNWSRVPLSAASDGDGGVFITLNKDDDFPKADLYLFKIDKYGYNGWNKPIHIGIEELQDKVELIEDGFGGVIACYRDLDLVYWDGFHMIWDYKIRVQRIDNFGNKLWGDGVLVSTDTTDQYEFDISTDEDGGCYVSWLSEKTMDYINSDGYRAIQHISANGERMWGDTGKVLYKGGVANYWNERHQIVSDNNGGLLIINTQDLNSFSFARLDINGVFIWEIPSRMDNNIRNIYSDLNGGLITFSSKWNTNYEFLIFEIDRINEYGEYSWNDKKTFADSVGDRSVILDLYFNEDTTASIYWKDYTYTTVAEHIGYYQVLNADGSFNFEDKGVQPFDGNFGGSTMLKSYNDYLCISGNYVQKLSVSGEKKWGAIGKQFTIRLANYDDFVSDKSGGFIKVWIEELNGLWVQQVSSNGNLGEVITNVKYSNVSPKSFKLLQNYPNPFNPSTMVEYELPEQSNVKIEIFNMLGQSVGVLINTEKQTGFYKTIWNAANLTSGIYFINITANGIFSNRSFTQVKKALLIK